MSITCTLKGNSDMILLAVIYINCAFSYLYLVVGIGRMETVTHRQQKGWGCEAAAPPDFKSALKGFLFLPYKYFLVCLLAIPGLTSSANAVT